MGTRNSADKRSPFNQRPRLCLTWLFEAQTDRNLHAINSRRPILGSTSKDFNSHSSDWSGSTERKTFLPLELSKNFIWHGLAVTCGFVCNFIARVHTPRPSTSELKHTPLEETTTTRKSGRRYLNPSTMCPKPQSNNISSRSATNPTNPSNTKPSNPLTCLLVLTLLFSSCCSLSLFLRSPPLPVWSKLGRANVTLVPFSAATRP